MALGRTQLVILDLVKAEVQVVAGLAVVGGSFAEGDGGVEGKRHGASTFLGPTNSQRTEHCKHGGEGFWRWRREGERPLTQFRRDADSGDDSQPGRRVVEVVLVVVVVVVVVTEVDGV